MRRLIFRPPIYHRWPFQIFNTPVNSTLAAHLFEQFADSRVELRIASCVALAYWSNDRHINRARLQFHQSPVARRDLYERNAQVRAVYQLSA